MFDLITEIMIGFNCILFGVIIGRAWANNENNQKLNVAETFKSKQKLLKHYKKTNPPY